MKRRCEFLDSLPAFNYNTGIGEPIQDEAGHNTRTRTDTRQLGSTLMKTMIEEVSNFCDPAIKRNWSEKPHQQVWTDRQTNKCSNTIHMTNSTCMVIDR